MEIASSNEEEKRVSRSSQRRGSAPRGWALGFFDFWDLLCVSSGLSRLWRCFDTIPLFTPYTSAVLYSRISVIGGGLGVRSSCSIAGCWIVLCFLASLLSHLTFSAWSWSYLHGTTRFFYYYFYYLSVIGTLLFLATIPGLCFWFGDSLTIYSLLNTF